MKTWYAVMTPAGYVSYMTQSLADADEMANSSDEVIIMEEVGPVDRSQVVS